MADAISLKDYNFSDLKKYPNVGQNRKKELVEFSYNGNDNLRPTGCKLVLSKYAKEEREKCKDFGYFVNNYVVVFVSGKGFTNITLRDYQYEINDIIEENQKILLLAGRRMGKTSTVLFKIIHNMLFNDGFKAGFSANDDALRKASMNVLRALYENLPPWLQKGVKKFNTQTIELENGSVVTSTVMSENSFRGEGYDFILCDEYSWSDKKEEFHDAVMPIVSESETTKFIITTTPNGMDEFYELWRKSEKGENSYARLKLPWWRRKDRDKSWYDSEVEEHGEKYCNQNHDVEFLGSSNTLLKSSTIRSLENFIQEPIDTICDDLVEVYEKAKTGYEYCIGVDTSKSSASSGEDDDYISLNVIRVDLENLKLKQVASCRTKEIHYTELSDIILELAEHYTVTDQPLVLIENNAEGASVADNLANVHEYENVFCEERRYDINGFRTTKTSKIVGLKNIKWLIENDVLELCDFSTINEFKTFVKNKTSYEAQNGSHDDCIMSLYASLFWLLEDNNIYEILMNDIKENLGAEVVDINGEEVEGEIDVMGNDLIRGQESNDWLFQNQ